MKVVLSKIGFYVQLIGDGIVERKGAVVLDAAVSKKKDSENQKPTVIRSCEDEIQPKNIGTKSETYCPCDENVKIDCTSNLMSSDLPRKPRHQSTRVGHVK